jgi:hypothetical protein
LVVSNQRQHRHSAISVQGRRSALLAVGKGVNRTAAISKG